MNKPRLIDRLRYAFDNSLARGPAALVLWLALALVTVVVIVTAGVALLWQGQPGTGYFGIFWNVLFQSLTPNPVDPAAGPWPFLLAMLLVTLWSLLLISTLIGIISAAIDSRIEKLRRGRSRVIETDHTVILGWSEQVFTIVAELVVAHAGRRNSCIVILGDEDQVEMEESIREKVGHTGHTRVVCRSGSPISLTDLKIVSLDTARSIIILGPQSDNPDSSVIKTILAVTKNPHRRPEPYHLVAEIRHPHNLEAAQLVGRDEAEIVLAGEPIARILAQTCHQSGLAEVYNELLDFSGSEIHFKPEPGLTGRTFGEALMAYETASVIGLSPAGGHPALNPPFDTVIQAGDCLMAIAHDDETIVLSQRADLHIEDAAENTRGRKAPAAERTLIFGWSWRGPSVITQLDNYVAPGSSALVVADFGPQLPQPVLSEVCPPLDNLAVSFRTGDITSRQLLGSLGLEQFTHVVVLAYADTMSIQEADAHTLVALINLRDIAERMGHPYSIVSEMLDLRNRALAEVTRADDFVVSSRMVSLMLAQISETKELNDVFNDLLTPEGSELYLKPAEDYVALGRPLNFYTVVEAARRRGEIAVGYRVAEHANDADRAYGVVMNPNKAGLNTFREGDRMIVVAQS
jgi:voltage-gated potassium channel Kch